MLLWLLLPIMCLATHAHVNDFSSGIVTYMYVCTKVSLSHQATVPLHRTSMEKSQGCFWCINICTYIYRTILDAFRIATCCEIRDAVKWQTLHTTKIVFAIITIGENLGLIFIILCLVKIFPIRVGASWMCTLVVDSNWHEPFGAWGKHWLKVPKNNI